MTDPLTTNSATDNLYLALLQCFAVILCGYIAGRSGIITKSESKGLNTFVGTFSLPALIFTSLAQLDLEQVNWKFLMAVTFAKASVFTAVLVITLLISRPINPGRAALFAIFATQSNDFAIGYPMINALYGQIHSEYAAYLYLMAPISLAILNPIGFILLEINKRRPEERRFSWFLLKSTAKGIAFNPILVMTVLGILGNFLCSHKIPSALQVILKVFGDAFAASALFLLGLMMVGKVHTLKGRALVIPGILISVKLLALPLVIRESVNLLSPGENATDTRDLSTFGFLYGTLPTAPALFVFTLRYSIDIDLIASAMVACTFLSAPLMFVSAKMIDAISADHTPADYVRELSAFALDASAVSTAACCWLLICFFIFEGKKYKRVTHRITVCLVVSQLITSIGVIIWSQMGSPSTVSRLWYVQFLMITGGVYTSRLWTAVLAATLLFLSSRSLSFVSQLQKWVLPIGWGLPILIVSLMAMLITPSGKDAFDMGSPNFQMGKIQAAISVFLIVFCFVVTLGCLVLQQRYQRRLMPPGYSSLTPSLSTNNGVNTPRNIVDVEDLMSQSTNISRHPCEFENNGCSNGTGCLMNREGELGEGCYDENSDDELITEQPADTQILRHLVLLILLLCSMFVGLALSIGRLVMEQLSGIYAELAFLDVALNFGQSLIAFVIFGLDPGISVLGKWIKKLCEMCPRAETLQLPDEESLTDEVRAVREQFAQSHLAECRTRIAACRRRLLRVYRGVFTGTDLVDWLLEAGLVSDRPAAVMYGRCLLDARVLCHVDGTEHFHDSNLLYTFST
ncbi:lysosomal cholesterol signaling protein [Neodiprion pinetum]|uniref:Integral membrane protein GPR155 n=1 Tax=Neodiprion lecontei TaxID=441921 RepID=A0A6J0C0A2_NEOLC|nr:integral membrane protein GPR155 [Neodiprion lecontei]XP_015519848.1 integral membrane protein GPR155 [Neodiprion lecontei]XP_046480302.1 integral membrane protein GPR155 [Neodiprion pinetum]XP_046480303.1 integral membrane protein GPR155 [Neodiprion pinetum]